MATGVLHVCDKFGVAGSSIHGVSRLFSWWFPRYDAARFDVSLCGLKSPEPGSQSLERQGIPVRHLGRGRFDPRILTDLVSLARERRARILHVHGYASADFGRLAARRVGAALVLHEHFADPRMPAYQAVADRALSSLTDRAIAVSESTRQFLVEKRHVPASRVRLIWNGAPLDEFAPVAAEKAAAVRRDLGLPAGAVVIGSIGRLNEQKGHRYLIEAAARVLAAAPQARLLIVGDGDLEGALKEQARALGIADKVAFAGHRDDVPAVLGAIDVFCISSTYEGTPLSLFEAMAAGKAIVSTAVDGCREVLEDGGTGLLVPARDAAALAGALAGLVADPARRESLGRAARQASARYDIRNCVDSMQALYDEVLRERSAGSVSVQRLTRQVREVWEVPRDLLLRRYPPFVTGGPLPRGHVPVFVFHSLEPDSFGRKLQYLADNGYRTLTAPEYLDVLAGKGAAPERAVVLTFDDGRASLASVGAPLLRRHGMTGIVFLVPGRTPAGAAPSSAGLPATALLTWDQVRTLSASGTFDFQSHTLHHSRIHVAPRVAGFMAPGMRSGYPAFDVPLVERDGRDLLAHDVPLGTPLLESAPRTSEALRFHEDPSPRQACVEAVAEAGGEAFFERPGWERELRRVAAEGARGWGCRFESDADREQAIRRELVEARELIERHTGRPVVHLCYPWHASGPTARRLAREAGYVTAFSGKVPGVPITPPGGDPQAIARIGEDYVELLPGRGRGRLLSVLRRKWSRRLGGGT